ncbi:MAG: FtsB family cell division protein [Candidatus Aminicenantales bacterium]
MNEKKSVAIWKKLGTYAIGFLLIVLLIFTVFGKKGLLEIARVRKIQADLVRDIDALKQEKARLEKEIAALKTDPNAVDKEARDKLWLMKPDEKVIVKKKK